MKFIFQRIMECLKRIGNLKSRSYRKRISILVSLVGVRSCIIMPKLKLHDLVLEMFQCFLQRISLQHLHNVLCFMERTMITVINESQNEEVSKDLVSCLLWSVRQEGMVCRQVETTDVSYGWRQEQWSSLHPFSLFAKRHWTPSHRATSIPPRMSLRELSDEKDRVICIHFSGLGATTPDTYSNSRLTRLHPIASTRKRHKLLEGRRLNRSHSANHARRLPTNTRDRATIQGIRADLLPERSQIKRQYNSPEKASGSNSNFW